MKIQACLWRLMLEKMGPLWEMGSAQGFFLLKVWSLLPRLVARDGQSVNAHILVRRKKAQLWRVSNNRRPFFVLLALEAFYGSLCDSRAPTLPGALIHFSLFEGSLTANYLIKGSNLEPNKRRSFYIFLAAISRSVATSKFQPASSSRASHPWGWWGWQEAWRQKGTAPQMAFSECATLWDFLLYIKQPSTFSSSIAQLSCMLHN